MSKILHIAPENFAGVPISFVKMHRQFGDESRLITLHKTKIDFEEDLCLNLPLPEFKLAKLWRTKKVSEIQQDTKIAAPFFSPKNIFEELYFNWSDGQRGALVDEVITRLNLNEYEIIHYDGGLDFFRNPTQALKWKKEGKKIVCCYYGSDLRSRGLIRELDQISELNITSEFDHLALKKNIEFLFYPYDASDLPAKSNSENDRVRIVHSPTNRKYKGTDLIISVIEKIKKEKQIEFVLLENIHRSEVLKIKSTCDISIDQVGGIMGGTGYGKAGLETLAMSIPTITNMTSEYEKWMPENPFIVANNFAELYEKLNALIEDKHLRDEYGRKGQEWVKKYHSFESVNKRLKELYRSYGLT
jgi:glycosyltransferase involved in cell wall biosynthesis